MPLQEHIAMSHDSNAMSVLETPVLLDLICDNLVEAVLRQCILVCKQWFALFLPYRWRSVSLHEQRLPTEASSLVPLLRQMRLLSRDFEGQHPTPLQLYAHWIRRLDLLSVPVSLFLDPNVVCSNLTRIKYQLDEKGGSNHSLDAIRMVAKHPRLTHVLLAGLNLSCPKAGAELIKILAGTGSGTSKDLPRLGRSMNSFPNLVHLDLTSYRNVSPQLLDTLLRSLPRTLRKLELALSIDEEEGLAWKSSRTEAPLQDASARRGGYEYREEYRLTSLMMDGRIVGIEESSFFPILSQSPELTRLILPKISTSLVPTLARIIKTCCPGIKKLDTYDDYGIRNNTLLIDACPVLEQVELMCTHHLTGTFLETLLMRSKTLTNLAMNVQAQVASPDIQLLMTVCSNLKVFRIHSDLEEGSGNAVLDIRDVYESDWTCLGLYDIDIMFTYVPSKESSRASGKKASAKEMVENVYRQLGRLTKLKMLAIGWLPGQLDLDVPRVDMSLESGLGHLHGLNELQFLDIERIVESGISEQEVEWMHLHWRNWRKLVPPYHYPAAADELGWVGYLQLLCPYVSV
ncbi:MAG: hypothetical protein BYD32DRAFT_412163, partial [Podila humilis]